MLGTRKSADAQLTRLAVCDLISEVTLSLSHLAIISPEEEEAMSGVARHSTVGTSCGMWTGQCWTAGP